MDKKRERREINYVLLEKVGKAVIKPVTLTKLEKLIQAIK
jgi:3-dehydroquinate synthase